MAPILIERVHGHLSGLLEDQVVNTFAFLTPTATYVEAEALAASNSLNNFYSATHAPATKPISDWLSETLVRAAYGVVHRVYDLTGHLDGSPHGSPKNEYAYSLPVGTLGTSLPSQVALCLSFHADYTGDPEFGPGTRPRARDRGRVYLGPFHNQCLAEGSVTQRPIPAAGLVDSIHFSALFLMNEPGHAWAVWSRRNAALEPVVGGWIDDSWDIQRRRKEDAVTRTTWGAVALRGGQVAL